MGHREVLMDRIGKRLRISSREGIGLCLIFLGDRRIRFLLFRGFFMICFQVEVLQRAEVFKKGEAQERVLLAGDDV